eukprot:TRINITY_DN23671_c0_g1_i1.p1 TRINITY_DN23671_c0_g1~~TRINITY_DN23671_c0_g1_i1.p1  ORF type:complete len:177 (+),score=38.23 TRINITY_DN23671_c0_g1_i1:178-708(+)
MACNGLADLGKQAGIDFHFDVQFTWHPLDAQRTLLWATTKGYAERYAEELAVLHFENETGSCISDTVLTAATRAGLDREEVERFLASDDLKSAVWQSYTDMVYTHNIHSIPLFIFNGPASSGGPFRPKVPGRICEPRMVNGSAGRDEFLSIFEGLYKESVSSKASLLWEELGSVKL